METGGIIACKHFGPLDDICFQYIYFFLLKTCPRHLRSLDVTFNIGSYIILYITLLQDKEKRENKKKGCNI